MLEQLLSGRIVPRQIDGEILKDNPTLVPKHNANNYPTGVVISSNGKRVAMSYGAPGVAGVYAGCIVLDQVIENGKPSISQSGAAIIFDPKDSFEANSTIGAFVSMDFPGEQLAFGASNAYNGGPGQPGTGGVILYSRNSDATWSIAKKFKSEAPITGGQYGQYCNFSPDGTMLAVSASGENSGYGRVYIYRRGLTSADWTLDATINNHQSISATYFGQTLTWSRDSQNLFISSVGRNVAAWYTREASGFQLKQVFDMPAEDNNGGTPYFGRAISVSLDNSYLLISAPGRVFTAGASGGIIYLYKLEGGEYVFKDKITGEQGTNSVTSLGENMDIDSTNSYTLATAFRTSGWVYKLTISHDDKLIIAWRKTYGGSISQRGIAMAREAAFWVLGDLGRKTIVYGR